MSTRPQPFNLPPGTNPSLNRSSLPPNPSYTDMPQSPTPSQLCSRLWSADRYPYLSFSLQFPFVGQWTRFATPVGEIDLTHDRHGWHLPPDIQKNLEHLVNDKNGPRDVDGNTTGFSSLLTLGIESRKPTAASFHPHIHPIPMFIPSPVKREIVKVDPNHSL